VLGRRQKEKPQAAAADFDPPTVDLGAISPDKTTVTLYVVAHGRFVGSDEQLEALQQKIHNHVGFALDRQMVAAHPTTEGMAWQIVLDCHDGEPDGAPPKCLHRSPKPYGSTAAT